MMKNIARMIVSGVEVIAVIGFALFVLGWGVAGANAFGIVGLILGLVLGGILGTLAFGLLFLAIENNQNLREIRRLLEHTPANDQPPTAN